jgi:hypothetical protein
MTLTVLRTLQELKGLRFAALYRMFTTLNTCEPYRQYLRRYGKSPKQVVLVGMNPGPGEWSNRRPSARSLPSATG